MREHGEWLTGVDGREWCKHCGALRHPNMDATCNYRPDGATARATPASVINDFDGLHARIQELRAAQSEALSRTEE